MLNIVVLISGQGSNLQAIIDAIESNKISAKITAIISNRSKAGGLERARKHSIPAYILPNRKGQSREDYDQRLAEVLTRLNPDLIVLAGFMRIFTANLVDQFQGKIINIHPSLLPKYRGLETHDRALDAGDKEHGCTVHYVTPVLDGGPIIAQAKLNICTNDDSQSLSAKVQLLEHRLYPMIIDWISKGRLELNENEVILDGEALSKPYLLN